MKLTQDEAEVLRRHVQLAKDIVACGEPDEARRLAEERNAGLSEGLDRGRLSLTVIAASVRAATVGSVNPKNSRRDLIVQVMALPQIVELADLARDMKPLLLK